MLGAGVNVGPKAPPKPPALNRQNSAGGICRVTDLVKLYQELRKAEIEKQYGQRSSGGGGGKGKGVGAAAGPVDPSQLINEVGCKARKPRVRGWAGFQHS